MDNTGTIPGSFVVSGAPTAPRAPVAPPLGLFALLPGDQRPATLDSMHGHQINRFSRISKDFRKFSKIMIFIRKIEVAKSVQKLF